MDYNQIKLMQQKNCHDCKDEIGLDFKVYSSRKYCKECYLNAVDVCDICKKEAKVSHEFYTVRIEEDGMKLINLCIGCSSKLQAC